MPEYYVGLMSGTSVDAIDAVAIQVDKKINLVACYTATIPDKIKLDILALCQPGKNEIERMGKLDVQLGELFAEAVFALLQQSGIKPKQIKAIGSHGQTIRHRPDKQHPFTLQIANPALISQLCNITTVADFRRADIAAGGQGAPLVPAFHKAFFTHKVYHRIVLNIGGMANISILPANNASNVSGFDTGPGNVLLNAWIFAHKKQAYDENGAWSSLHSHNEALLKKLLSHPYFTRPPPKSTGREAFDLHWINEVLATMDSAIHPGVVQSTLCELSAQSISEAIKKYAPHTSEILICGGGVHNHDLISRIETHLGIQTKRTDEFGIDADYVEAVAFAWLARQTLHLIPGNLPAVTGAREPAILGAIYPRWAKGT
ncbi:MAG TPA: anhydro-N-acetylmuramic acid kinase [Gammaproteobacteria bacterium]|nr:anhydro-N-acetylmuramic acid kinase [Gammaproteobacteria bacterium]